MATIASDDPNLTVKATGGIDADPGALKHIAELIAEGHVTVPIAARYQIEDIRDAVAFQASRHAQGKVVITL